MDWFFLGLSMWCLVHFMPSLGGGLKPMLIAKFGDKGYRGVFAAHLAVTGDDCGGVAQYYA